jgi:tetratricopeptide (TPR) repeat protein
MANHHGHLYVMGATCADRLAAVDRLLGPEGSAAPRFTCHHLVRGPYTGLGMFLRSIVPTLYSTDPAAVLAHQAEIVAVAPELADLVGWPAETLTSSALGNERTRWYSRLRTRRIAHGVVDLLRVYAADAARTAVFDAVSDADTTDREFLAIALRRLDPGHLRVVVAAGDGSLGEELDAAVRGYAQQVDAPSLSRPADVSRELASAGVLDLARAFVASDGTSDDPAEQDAYARVDAATRSRLHDERADELDGRGEVSLSLGAIPYHRVNGSAPGTAGWDATIAAIGYCMGSAFYDAAAVLCQELTDRADFYSAPERYWESWYLTAHALSLSPRLAEVKPIYYDLLSRYDGAHPHMTLHYAISLLYTRLFSPQEKDHRRALAHANTAVAIAGLMPEDKDRAFHLAFMKNGRALVTMHLGDLADSLSAVEDGIARLDRELAQDRHRLHRSVLHHNRAQLLGRMGRPTEALAEFSTVLSFDPNYQEYWFDRGNLHYELGHFDEAAADFEQAARLGPPFPELFQNRGALRAAIGDLDGAVADYRYVLDMEPDVVSARVCLASLLVDLGLPQQAVEEARTGLEYAPSEARLAAVEGLALLTLGQAEPAGQAFARALALDPGNQVALVNRAVLSCEQGRPDDAVADLIRALTDDPDNPDLAFNLGYAYEAAGRTADAIAEYTRTLDLPGADRADLLYRRGSCHAGLGHSDLAHADYAAHLTLGPSPYAEEIGEFISAAASA